MDDNQPAPEFEEFRNAPIEVPAAPDAVAALTVEIEVAHVEPRVWRRLVVRGDLTLDGFHQVIQTSVGWEESHLHRFWLGDAGAEWSSHYFVTDFDLEEGDEGTPEEAVRLDQVLREVGDRLGYTYDFGDNWTHSIHLESVGDLDPEAPTAVCTAGEMAGPLEDSGGPPAYNELVEAILDDPTLAGLEDHLREWLPPRWDPTQFDLDQVNTMISLIGATPAELAAALAGTPDLRVEVPEALEPLLTLASPDVVADIATMCRRAAGARPDLEAADLAAIARPYRFLVDLAGQQGIPLTPAGWMKPTVVQEVISTLQIRWIGVGNRESAVPPVAALRELTRDLGLLRKRKGLLLRTRLAAGLTRDSDYALLLAERLVQHDDPWVRGARALLALVVAAGGRADLEGARVVAHLMTRCGLSMGPHGVDEWDALELARPTWTVLEPTGVLGLPAHPRRDQHAVALAVAALWPDRRAELELG